MNKIKRIESILKLAFQPSYLEVIDESDQHRGHAGHQGGGRHFAVVITAPDFNGISRVSAHRKIYSALSEMIPGDIHALRIVIKQ